MPSRRTLLVVAVALAFVAGLAQGARILLPAYLVGTGAGAETVSTITVGLSVLLPLVDPFAVFALGYLWGERANVSANYLGFGGRLFAAAFVGFVTGYAALLLSIPNVGGATAVRTVAATAIRGIESGANVALAGLAASAIAHFRGRRRQVPDDGATRPGA